PRITGFELLDALKKVAPRVTIVLVTAYARELGPVIRLEHVQAKIADCLPKPLDIGAVHALLRRLAARRHLEALGRT
ncbi:MAG: hypothetical protein HYV08_06990, partial [Deltaproteobacteria bacterium]|nr:hypothetical protein [Deltaproteobacteria bacterium]